MLLYLLLLLILGTFRQLLLVLTLQKFNLVLLLLVPLFKSAVVTVDLVKAPLFVLNNLTVGVELEGVLLLCLLVYFLAKTLKPVEVVLVLLQVLKLRQNVLLQNRVGFLDF